MQGDGAYPRPLADRELGWLRLLLPGDRPGYRALWEHASGLLVLGIGRWGEGDMLLGSAGQEVDPDAGMMPILSYGEIAVTAPDGAALTLSLALHAADDEGRVELHATTLEGLQVPDAYVELRRWSYAGWLPGAPCPATGMPVREIGLDDGGRVLLAIAPSRRVLWLHDGVAMTNTPVPVTNFYNELMLLKGMRDPAIALDHTRLFSALDQFSDAELRSAFIRYNMSFRKIDPERLSNPSPAVVAAPSLLARLANLLRRRG